MTWDALLTWAQSVDERDLPDAARHWAADESAVTALPENVGEWQATLELAFAAGMRWAQRVSACPRCGSDEIRAVTNYGRPNGETQCLKCGRRWETAKVTP